MFAFLRKKPNIDKMVQKAIADMFREELELQGIAENELNSTNITKISIALSSRLAAGELKDRISCHLE